MLLPLLIGLIVTIAVSSMASGMLRSASEELAVEVRDRVFKSENRRAWLWRYSEWLGIALILAGMFLPQMMLFTAKSQRVICIAAGLVLFCFSNAMAAWSSFTVYKKEAPGTNATRAAFRGAVLVSLAETVLLVVVFWIVSVRLDWMPSAKPGDSSAETASEDKSLWVDESIALKELASFDRDYVEGRVEGGSLRTKMIAGKRMYHAGDVERLKKQKKENIPE